MKGIHNFKNVILVYPSEAANCQAALAGSLDYRLKCPEIKHPLIALKVQHSTLKGEAQGNAQDALFPE